MTTTAAKAKLLAILENSDSTADFLNAVQAAVETLYSDSDEPPTKLFAALESAVAAAEAHETEHA